MSLLNFQLEKEFVEQLISYLGSKPWLEVQHLVTPLLQNAKIEAAKVENTIKVAETAVVNEVKKIKNKL